jgi:cholesterol oxidase
VSSLKQAIYDYVVIGSGFGGSVAAMRLAEKGYSVLVIERGKRYRDQDFAKSNWAFWKYLWNPALRSFGILQISTLDGMLVLHGSGLGGGSLGYANVLMEPDPALFDAPGWRDLADWRSVLRPHYAEAKRMLGVAPTPRAYAADETLKQVAVGMGRGASYAATGVGVFFGPEGERQPDPYFDGRGPERAGCIHCGACMVGCRHNAKNTLVKNYLYFAEHWGAELLAEHEVRDIRPLADAADGARYEVRYRPSTRLLKPERSLRARNVVLAAGVMGTLKLLFRCRDQTGALPNLSPRLGDNVRTNSEALLGATARDGRRDFSRGVAIGSLFAPDAETVVQAVRYPAGSSLMRFLAAPIISGGHLFARLLKAIVHWLRHPVDFLRAYLLPGWARRTTILLVMQKRDNYLRVRPGRNAWTLFRRGLVTEQEADESARIPAHIKIGHDVAQRYADRIGGAAAGSLSEGLLGMPATAHILGGVPMGRSAAEGVVDAGGQVHNYPGLYVVDGSIVPANPGINPSLTITALAEYMMNQIEPKT